jgi:hypothetical protein
MWYSWGAWAQVRTSSTRAMHIPKKCPLIATLTRNFSMILEILAMSISFLKNKILPLYTVS